MSTYFDEITKTDLEWQFSSDGEFNESGVYTKTVSGAAVTRTINVVVDRDPPEPADANGQLTRPKMIIAVKNDGTLGIASDELDTGKDTFTIAYKVGDTPKAYAIRRIKEDVALLTLGLH